MFQSVIVQVAFAVAVWRLNQIVTTHFQNPTARVVSDNSSCSQTEKVPSKRKYSSTPLKTETIRAEVEKKLSNMENSFNDKFDRLFQLFSQDITVRIRRAQFCLNLMVERWIMTQ